MEPIEFLARVEQVNISLFEAYLSARKFADGQRWIYERMKQHNSYKLEHQIIEDESRRRCERKLAEAHHALLLADVAAGASAGAIFQFARQAISIAWPTYKDRMTKGRKVGTQYLSRIIWHARNQALHFDEGIPKNEDTRKSIECLFREFDKPIADLEENPKALSVEIFDVLGWNDYKSYANDMADLVSLRV